jgi:hypothetical protein
MSSLRKQRKERREKEYTNSDLKLQEKASQAAIVASGSSSNNSDSPQKDGRSRQPQLTMVS